jgi:hypothetical protein
MSDTPADHHAVVEAKLAYDSSILALGKANTKVVAAHLVLKKQRKEAQVKRIRFSEAKAKLKDCMIVANMKRLDQRQMMQFWPANFVQSDNLAALS